MEHKNLKTVMNYVNDIKTGKKIACKELIQAVNRFEKDLEDPRYEIIHHDAEFCISIIQKTFFHIKGTAKGKPFFLEDWQKFIIYNLCSIYLKGTKERKYKEAFIFLPRKNSKTFFASALAWSLSLLERNNFSALYLVATKLDRALEAFNNILENIENMGEKGNFRILNNNSEHSISRSFYNADGDKTGTIRIQAIASDAKRSDGINANLFILDEIHAYKNANEYHVYKQATKAYLNKLVLGITTAGSNMNSFCYSRLQYCQKILNDEVQDDQYFVFITKADNPDNYTDLDEIKKANPNFGISIFESDIVAEALQAQNDPTARAEFLNKSLNIYTNSQEQYFDIGEIQISDEESTRELEKLLGSKLTIEKLSKLNIDWYGGADLSKMFDLTASCIYGRYKEIDICISMGFIPITQARAKAEEDNIPFFWWVEKGWLQMSNSDLVEYEEVVKWFVSMRNMGFKIKNVGFDKYNSREFVRSMEKQKFKMKESRQQYWVKSEAFRELERKIKSRKFCYLTSKSYEYCISNVKAFEDSEDKIKYEKVSNSMRIDLFDASIMALKELIISRDKKSKLNDWL